MYLTHKSGKGLINTSFFIYLFIYIDYTFIYMPRIAYTFSLMALYKCRYLLHRYVIACLQCTL